MRGHVTILLSYPYAHYVQSRFFYCFLWYSVSNCTMKLFLTLVRPMSLDHYFKSCYPLVSICISAQVLQWLSWNFISCQYVLIHDNTIGHGLQQAREKSSHVLTDISAAPPWHTNTKTCFQAEISVSFCVTFMLAQLCLHYINKFHVYYSYRMDINWTAMF